MLTIIYGDALKKLRELPEGSVQCCVTSPPYWGLRDYGVAGQIGLEETPAEYVDKLVEVFSEVRRVLCEDGTLWLNLGDSYARNGGKDGGRNRELLHMEGISTRMCKIPDGSYLKPKDLVGIPWRVAFALQADSWYLRSDIIWHKPNPMPESVTDRPTKAHEYLFLLSKQERYFYDADAISESLAICVHQNDRVWGLSGRRNKRSVWTVPTASYEEAHFAIFPPDLIKPCILAGSQPGSTVLDPFAGSGTTGEVALELGRRAVLVELNPEYIRLIEQRCSITQGFAF
jgi:DNA modification methylase